MSDQVIPTSEQDVKKIAQEAKTIAREITSENNEQISHFEKKARQYAEEKTAKESRIFRYVFPKKARVGA